MSNSNMRFLLQTDDVSQVEKRVVRSAAMLADYELYFASLDSDKAGFVGLPVDAVPVGSVEFVTAVMQSHGIPQPPHLSYPDCLFDQLYRKVWEGNFADNTDNVFVKPRHGIKTFTGALRSELDPNEVIPDDFPVWFSEPVKFISEWRYYVSGGDIVGAGRYDDGEDDMPVPDLEQVKVGVAKMSKQRGSPSGYSLDFGVLEDGRTALVEANDGWALGYYKGSCSPTDYAKLLHARWIHLAYPAKGAR